MGVSLAILQNRSYLFYWLAAWASALGDLVFTVGVSWMITQTFHSGVIMGTFLLIMGAVRSAFMLFGGVLVDRMSPMRLMKVSLLARAVMMGLLMIVSANSSLSVWMLDVLAAVFGVVDAFFMPTASAARQRLVTEEYYTQSNSLLMVAGQVSVIVGPVVGSFLIGLGGGQLLYGTIAAMFVLSLGLLNLVRLRPPADSKSETEPPAAKKEPPSFTADLREGLQYVLRTPLLLVSISSAMLVNAGISVLTVALPFLAADMNAGVEGFGIMSSGIGIGGAIGAVVFTLWMIKRPTPQMNLTACLLEGLAVLSLFWVHNVWVAAVVLAFTGVTTTAINILAPSVNQSIIPEELFGRVISVMMLAMGGMIPISQAFSGFLIDQVNAHQVFLYGGLLEACAALLALFAPSVRAYGKISGSK
ncbi:MFS transporter [Tumebacillus flagellatus]|uniref:Major facilitator superfamily (MFS) profile domain-containing protein n=1 Tax=Tumebacillus flagellatus TaxID=1157490 RepID=A0A074LNT4_9BACL|nr:MFS transporter [Tumebacillus flagellatus]KEO83826.1 hypothetical protein EL26_07875 [Tumebacillus flagellatus]